MMTEDIASRSITGTSIDAMAQSAVVAMGNVFAEPESLDQQKSVAQLTALLWDVQDTLDNGGWFTPQAIRQQAQQFVKTLQPYLYDADFWGNTEISTAQIHRRAERAVADAIRFIVTQFTVKAVMADER
jgi:hypothetical protein